MTTSTGPPASGVAANADGPVWHTLNAGISGLLQAEQAAKTPLTRQLDKLTRQIPHRPPVSEVISHAVRGAL